MRKILMVCLLAASIGLLPLAPAVAAQQSLRMGTASVGALFYVFGAAISEVVGKHAAMKIEVLPQGNIMTLPLMASHEVDLVMLANDELEYAYLGRGIFERQTKGKGYDVRLLMLGMRNAASQLVPGDSGIKTYEDLRGKRVVLDHGTQQALNLGSRASLIAGGLTEKDVVVIKASDIPEAVRLVTEKKADACFGGIGVPAFRELAAARGGILYLEAGDKHWPQVHQISKAYFPMTVKKGPLGIDRDTVLVTRNFDLVARADLSESEAYTIVKTVWENDAELAPKHPQLKDWVKERFVGEQATAPYHPGAIKLYKEKGVWTEKMQAHQDALLKMKKK
ncbi:MAG: TAXI family TRAP transporter solute-binding subunit [Desulfobacteraceae bacterium]|nr:MAG: TAXI family TRAP transporter solute-binding subunit [Desulfobacteraceae bacterium]